LSVTGLAALATFARWPTVGEPTEQSAFWSFHMAATWHWPVVSRAGAPLSVTVPAAMEWLGRWSTRLRPNTLPLHAFPEDAAGPAAFPVLAVRSARRGVALNPDDPTGHAELFQAILRLMEHEQKWTGPTRTSGDTLRNSMRYT